MLNERLAAVSEAMEAIVTKADRNALTLDLRTGLSGREKEHLPPWLKVLSGRGEQADLLLDVGKLLVRRSQTIGESVLNTAKQTRHAIELPPTVLDVMRWHIETQLETP